MLPPLLRDVLGAIRRHRMVYAGDRVAVAVSGGGDSVALLTLLLELRERLGVTLSVAHFNHGLRGEESDQDQRSVQASAAALGVECFIQHSAFRIPQSNLEAATRNERYAFFTRLVTDGQATKVATAHTADDQAETVLGRMLRGAGTAGQAGIYPVRDGMIIRPLLGVRRADLRAWAAAQGLQWREDSSNLDPRFLRNRLRLDLLPLVEERYNPGIVGMLGGAADLARGEEDFWQRHIEALAARVLQPADAGWKLSLPDFVHYHEAEQRRLLREALRRIRGHLHRIDFQHVEQVRRLALESASGRLIVLPGCCVRRGLDALLFQPVAPATGGFERVVEVPGVCALPEIGRRLVFKLVNMDSETAGYNQNGADCLLARDAVSNPVSVRNWRPGDVLETARGRKKLKVLLLERRVAGHERRLWPVAVCGGEVIWCRGFPVPPSLRWKGPGTEGLCVCEEELVNADGRAGSGPERGADPQAGG